MPRGAVRDGMLLDRAAVLETLQALVAEQGWQGRRAFAAVGGSRLITRHLRLPAMPRADLARAVTFEAERYLPVGLAGLSTDFAVLGKERDQEGEKLVLLLAAVPQEMAYAYAELFAAAGLELAALDIVPLALQRVLLANMGPQAGAEKALVILDIGHSTSHVVILWQGWVELCRAVARGWGEAEEVVAAASRLAVVGARGERRPAPAQGPALETVLAGIAREVRRSLDFFRSQRRQADIGELYLSGGVSPIGEVSPLLEGEVGLAIRLLWPSASHFTLEPGSEVALGTALRQVVA
jgi:type IV pilus assembly protein PilM